MRRLAGVVAVLVTSCAPAVAQKGVPAAPPAKAAAKLFHDRRYGVRFDVPAGWQFNRKDGEVSTFHLDARSAGQKSEMRGVASMNFNPYPLSTLSGAMFYYSVQKHVNDHDCESQAGQFSRTDDTLNIDGIDFSHGHNEHGEMCVEARDDVYTAYRKGSCYRFDLEVNTFCAASSGAMELTRRQFNEIESRMTGILDSVKLDWRQVHMPSKDATERKHRSDAQNSGQE